MKPGLAALAAAATPALAGCLSLPPYRPEGAVVYTEDALGATVAGRGFALHFAGGTGFHFPDKLLVDGVGGSNSVDILGHDAMASCYEESGSGVMLQPSARISPDGVAEPANSRFEVILRGPAAVQVRVGWAVRLACSAMHEPQGAATYTVFPDGRIVRHDRIDDPSTEPLSAISCACPGGPAWFTASPYWSFPRSVFAALYLSDKTMEPVPAPDIERSNQSVACLAGDGHQLSSAWRAPLDSTIRGVGPLIAIGRYLLFKDTSLHSFPWDTSAALFLDHSDCDTALTRARDYAEPPGLAVTSATSPVVLSEIDGIYGGDPGGDGSPGIELSSVRTQLTGAIHGSFAVWLRFPRRVDAVRATLTGDTGGGPSGPWYLPQQIDDRSWILWFRDPLLGGQAIVVEPL